MLPPFAAQCATANRFDAMARNKSDDDARPVVYVVDDDRMFCEWLVAVLDTVDVRVVVCETPSEFLATFSNEGVGCIVLDVRLPEMSGLRLHQRLIDDGVAMPVLIITAYGDVSQAVQSIKSGAVDYIQKPAVWLKLTLLYPSLSGC